MNLKGNFLNSLISRGISRSYSIFCGETTATIYGTTVHNPQRISKLDPFDLEASNWRSPDD